MNIGLYVGAFSTSTIGVFQMKNFNPLTIAFWATLIGLFVLAFIVGSVGDKINDIIKKKIKQWHGTGATLSKG